MNERLKCMYCNTNMSWVEVENIETGEVIKTIGCKTCWKTDEKFMLDFLFGKITLIQ